MNGSVIICCYNSSNRIRPTLEHLGNQNLQNLTFEVILVNNNCNDDTVYVAKKVWLECGTPFNLHIIEEKQAGLSNARKAGVLAAKGEIVIFCDDDNWLSRDYLYNAYMIMRDNKSIGVLGGYSEPKFDYNPPHWFSTYQLNYAVGVQEMTSGNINKKGFVWGAGMTLRKSILINLFDSGFDFICVDRNTKTISSGGDFELCQWHLLIGLDLWYDERLCFYHYISNDRLSITYLKLLRKSFIDASKILVVYKYLLKAKAFKKKQLKYKYLDFLKLIFNISTRRISIVNLFLELSVFIPGVLKKQSLVHFNNYGFL